MKVAWYDREGTGLWRDINILMHWPYTAWHLAYVVIGASLVEDVDLGVLGWTLLAFFLAMGIGAHLLDELKGRPLNTSVPDGALWVGAAFAIAGAIVIGFFGADWETSWIIPCIFVGGFMVVAYNLELWFFHRDEWFALSWGSFPVITAFIAQAHTLRWEAIAVAAGCFFLSLAQRTLSKQARFWRRKVSLLDAHYFMVGGELSTKLQTEDIIRPAESALHWMTLTVVLVAIGMLLGAL